MSEIIVSCAACGVKNRIPDKKQHLKPRCGKCGIEVSIGSSAVPVSLGDDDFQTFLQSTRLPIVVDFFSPNCGPCQALAPLIRMLSGVYLGRVIVAMIDTNRHPGTSAHFQIRGVPSLLFFKNGVVVDQTVGAPTEQELVAKIDTVLNP